MRTAGLTMNDVWADRVLRERGVEAYRYDGLEAEIGVLVDSVDLKHRGKQENHRPYLHIIGELRSITPAEPLPYGITQVTYRHGQGEKVDAYYDFDDQQLVALVGKGYFNPSFAVPDQLTGIEWELPAIVDALVLAPREQQADSPVVFMQVHRIADLEIDLESSGYDLSEYFADHSADGSTYGSRNGWGRVEVVVDERGLRARSNEINSLFTDDELDLVEQASRRPRPDAPAETDPENEAVTEVEAESVSAGLHQLEAEIAAEREQFHAELERTDGTLEHLYHERVAHSLHPEQHPEQHLEQPTVPLMVEDDARPAAEDTGVGPDLEVGPNDQARLASHLAPREQVRSGSTVEDRKRETSRRVDDLDFDLDFGQDGEHALGS